MFCRVALAYPHQCTRHPDEPPRLRIRYDHRMLQISEAGSQKDPPYAKRPVVRPSLSRHVAAFAAGREGKKALRLRQRLAQSVKLMTKPLETVGQQEMILPPGAAVRRRSKRIV